MSDGFKVPSVPASKSIRQPEPHFPPLKYTPPSDGCVPQHQYTLDVIKDGQILESHDIACGDKTFFTFGRLPVCDFPMEHGSISRYHAVLQFTENDVAHIHDLGSAHGTLVNKEPVVAGVPKPIDIGDQIRFGASSRIWILNTSDTELIEKHDAERYRIAQESAQQREQTRVSDSARDNDGDRDDSDDGNDLYGWKRNPNAAYHRDPVKYLKELLVEMDYKYKPEIQNIDDSESFGKRGGSRQVSVRISLPFDDAEGNPLYGAGRGQRRQDAERLACLDALEELDRRGFLNLDNSRHGSGGKRDGEDNINEDSDDSDFYDFTKPVKVKHSNNKAETFESLTKKLDILEEDMVLARRELDKLSGSAVDSTAGGNDDDEIDSYMKAMEQGEQTKSKKKLESKLVELQDQKLRLTELLGIVAPDSIELRKRPQAEPETIQRDVTASSSNPPPKKRQRQQREQEHRHSPEKPIQSNVALPAGPPTKEQVPKSAVDASDDKTVEWQPPVDQSGDGRTSLNDKLGY
ncbi:hypothetical protein LPJ53_003178 [Coemansia erecta]|uniref:FHA domain-containing protein n=1 Tax=Coemansia erecta TaxID=147472 RepID=A0A9W7XWQ9_9FUNG|nr:hypothetical protein LPJ53_003178 [Coemansia erecta]